MRGIQYAATYQRHCEPPGRANARPMTGSAKQSMSAAAQPVALTQIECGRRRLPAALVIQRRKRSEYEFDAEHTAPAPDHFAGLALGMIRHQRQLEAVGDVDLGVGHDPGAARRNVHHHAFGLRDLVVDRQPGHMLAQLPARLALYLWPWRINSRHDEHPSWD